MTSAAPRETPCTNADSRWAFSRSRLARIFYETLYVWDTYRWQCLVQVKLADPTRIVATHDGSFLVFAADATYHLPPDSVTLTALPRISVGPWAFGDPVHATRFWSVSQHDMSGYDRADAKREFWFPASHGPSGHMLDATVLASGWILHGQMVHTIHGWHPDSGSSSLTTGVQGGNLLRLLPSASADEFWMVPREGTELYRCSVFPAVPMRARIPISPNLYDVATGHGHVGMVLVADEDWSRPPRFFLRVMDSNGRRAMERELQYDPRGRMHHHSGWSSPVRPAETMRILMSATEPLVAVGGAYRLSVFSTRDECELFAVEVDTPEAPRATALDAPPWESIR